MSELLEGVRHEIVRGNRQNLDFSALGQVLPGVGQKVEERAVARMKEGAGPSKGWNQAPPLDMPGPARAAQPVKPATGAAFMAGLQRAKQMTGAPDTEEEWEKQKQEQRKDPFGAQARKKAAAARRKGTSVSDKNHHEDLLDEDDGVEDAKPRESEQEKELKRLRLSLQIRKIREDREFHDDLERYGLLKTCTNEKLDAMTTSELKELKRLINMALGASDGTESLLGLVRTGAGLVEQASSMAFQRWGWTPLDGFSQELVADPQFMRTVKRHALESDLSVEGSTWLDLLKSAGTTAYQRYQRNQAVMTQAMQTQVVTQAQQDEFKDL